MISLLRYYSPVPRKDNIWDFPSSCVCLFLHATVLLDSADPSHPRLLRMILCCLRCTLKPSTIGTILFSELYQLSGNTVSPTAYKILCVRFVCFVRCYSFPCRENSSVITDMYPMSFKHLGGCPLLKSAPPPHTQHSIPVVG